MGKYFNYSATEGVELYGRLRVVEHGDGFQVVKGGYEDAKGKLKQADVIAYCENKEEAEKLVEKLCNIN